MLLKLYLSQKAFIEVSPIIILKSPTIIILSYCDKSKSKLLLIVCRWLLYYLYLGYRNRKLIIFFCKLISIKILSVGKVSTDRSFAEILP